MKVRKGKMKKCSRKIIRILGIVLTLILLPGMIPYVSADTAAEFAEETESALTAIADADGTVKRMQSEVPATYYLDMGNLAGTAVDNGVSIVNNEAIFSAVNPLDTYVVTGTSNTNRIVINPSETVNLTLSGVNIKNAMPPIQLLDNAVVDMTLSGANTLKCNDWAGLHVGQNATLTIGGTFTDTLNTRGGINSAGIGTSFDNNFNCCGTVNITGGLITATGGVGGGAGIGGSVFGDGGKINITGGMVTATGGGAGIGGGYYKNGGVIKISGGTVTATGGNESMDIGYGGKGEGGTTVITGGSVLPTRGSSYVNNPTNGQVNGGDKVDMTTLTSLALQDFSFEAAGSKAVYTYAGTGHEAAGYLWMPLPGATTDAVTDVNTTPAVVTAPDTVNSPASSMATLNGTFYLNNTSPVTSAYFEWGTAPSYDVTIPVAGSSGETATDAILRSTNLTGLKPGTDYNYRFVIETNGNRVYGDNITFTTPVLAPSVDATHNVTGATTATLYGIFDLNGGTFQSGEFQISTTGSDGPWVTLTNTSTPAVSSAAGVNADTGKLDQSTNTPSVNLTSLTLNTDYYYRFIVTNNVDTSEAKGSWHQEGFSTLKIDKTVTGSYGDPNKEFEITITLMDGSTPVTDSFEFTGSAISGVNAPEDSSIFLNEFGQGTIKLKHGQAITIDGMPSGCNYTVKETDPAVTGGSYNVKYHGNGIPSESGDSISGTLESTMATVSITNERSSVPASGLNESFDYCFVAVGFVAVLTMLFCCCRRRKCK